MSTKIASLYADISANTTGLQNGLNQTKTGLSGLVKQFAPAITGAAALTVGIGLTVKGLKWVVSEAAEAEKASAQLGAVLTSTNYAAGMTTKELNNLADSLSAMSGIDDELIVKNEAIMLTFTRIGEQVFPQAMEAALDISVALGQDLQSSVIMVGKAMNVAAGDTSGASMALSAMKRVGVAFTTQQIDMAKQAIATGDTLAYQKIILGELGTEFGGQAKAMGGTYAGAVNTLKVAFGNLGESIGISLLPPLTEAITSLSTLVNLMANYGDIEDVFFAMMEESGFGKFSKASGFYDIDLSKFNFEDVKAMWERALEYVTEGGDYSSFVQGVDGATSSLGNNTTATNNNGLALGGLTEALGGSKRAWGYASSAAEDYNGKLEDQIKLEEALALAKGDVTQEDLDNKHAQEMLVSLANEYGLKVEALVGMMADLAMSGGNANDVLMMISNNLYNLPREQRTKILIEQFGYRTGTWGIGSGGVANEFGQLIDMGGGGGTGGPGGDWVKMGPATTPGKSGWYMNSKTGAYSEFARGGNFSAGQGMLVGEQGPELIVPNRSGYVVPNDQLSEGGNKDEMMIWNALSRIPSADDIALAVRDAFLLVSG